MRGLFQRFHFALIIIHLPDSSPTCCTSPVTLYRLLCTLFPATGPGVIDSPEPSATSSQTPVALVSSYQPSLYLPSIIDHPS